MNDTNKSLNVGDPRGEVMNDYAQDVIAQWHVANRRQRVLNMLNFWPLER